MSHSSGSPDASKSDRRSFLGAIAVVLAGLFSAAGAVIGGVFAAAPALRAARKDSEFSPVSGDAPKPGAGPTLHTVAVTTEAGWSVSHAKSAVFLDASPNGSLRAFSARCPHEGCRVDWRPAAGEYVCPCHNSHFSRDGARTAGPAKRGLDPLDIRDEDGRVAVRYRTFALDTPERVEVG